MSTVHKAGTYNERMVDNDLPIKAAQTKLLTDTLPCIREVPEDSGSVVDLVTCTYVFESWQARYNNATCIGKVINLYIGSSLKSFETYVHCCLQIDVDIYNVYVETYIMYCIYICT